MKNECILCSDVWSVNLFQSYLDDLDNDNISNYGQLYSYCEDCNNGTCESAEK